MKLHRKAANIAIWELCKFEPLNPITPHIRQLILQVIVEAIFIIPERIFGVAGPAAQTNSGSGSIYLQGCFALPAPEKIVIHHLLSLIESVSGENTAKNWVCQTQT